MDWGYYLVFDPQDPRLEIYAVVYDGTVSILNSETRCSSSTASQLQWASRQRSSCCVVSSQEQVCYNTEYDPMFGSTALALLSGPGRR